MEHVVRIRREVVSHMVEEVRCDPSLESCGLLGGRGGVISAIFPAQNSLASPSEFEIAPAELFRMFRELRASRLDHLGIYHSHPAGDNAPSTRDIERAFYPDVAYFVVSPLPDAPRPVRAFSIREGRVTELAIKTLG